MSKRKTCLILTVALAASCTPAKAASGDASGPFDGKYLTTLTCPKSEDGALAYSFQFPVTIKDNMLHGERGTKEQAGWMTLDGPVKSDGTAALIADGRTSSPAYTVHGLDRNTHYRHAVNAHFDAHGGEGTWITIRTCTFAFDKQTD